MSSLQKWQLSKPKEIFHSKIFTIESHMAINPRNGVEDEYYTAKISELGKCHCPNATRRSHFNSPLPSWK